jgi:hypothetical protein
MEIVVNQKPGKRMQDIAGFLYAACKTGRVAEGPLTSLLLLRGGAGVKRCGCCGFSEERDLESKATKS